MANDSTMRTVFTTPSDREIVSTRVFDAPRALVFEVWTDPTHVSQWMLGPDGWTMPVCEMDPRTGGAWRMVWRNADGAEMAMRGTYRDVTPPKRIVTTESWGDGWPETVNTTTFAERDGRTTVTQTVVYPSQDARDAAMKTGMMQGMNQSFDRAERYLQSLTSTRSMT